MNSTTSITYDCLLSPDFAPRNITSLPDTVIPTWMVISVIDGIAAPPTVVINLLIIWTVMEDEGLRSINYNLLIAALAVPDLLVGLVVEPLFVWWLGCLLVECAPTCQYSKYAFSGTVCCSLTLCTLMVASVERYIAHRAPTVLHHQYYQEKDCNRNSNRLVNSANCSDLRKNNGEQLRRSAKNSPHFGSRWQRFGHSFLHDQSADNSSPATKGNSRASSPTVQQQEQQHRLWEYKRAFTMAILVFASILFYCPVMVTLVIQALKGKDVTDDFKYIAYPIYATFGHLQSLVNPLIMSLRMSCVRQGVKKRLHGLLHCRRS
ncbi:hypothetical protein QZH41_003897 [Actinostola sp. cb2023]|nr:hypothetical protein QZH41_003897 [Actinostola sp. cb2023]